MSKYQNGKIYKIVDVGYNKTYYGSTCESLSQRMTRHRAKYTAYLKGNITNTRSFDLFDEFGIENCKIELVENYPCNSKEELRRREGYYIKNNDCINKCVPCRTPAEYYQDENEYCRFRMTFTKNFIKKKNRNIIEDGFKKENTSCWKNICVVVANITHFNTKKDTRNHKSTKTG